MVVDSAVTGCKYQGVDRENDMARKRWQRRTHYRTSLHKALCGNGARHAIASFDRATVTCERCLDRLAAVDARRAKQAAEVTP